MAADVRRGCPAAIIARRFHSTLVEIVAQVCGRLRQRTGLDAVVLSGGVFLNALLTTEVDRPARTRGLPGLPASPGAARRRRAEPGPARRRGGAACRHDSGTNEPRNRVFHEEL